MDEDAAGSGNPRVVLICSSGSVTHRVPRETADDVMARAEALRRTNLSHDALRDLIEIETGRHLHELGGLALADLKATQAVRSGILLLAFALFCADVVTGAALAAALKDGRDIDIRILPNHARMSWDKTAIRLHFERMLADPTHGPA